MEKRKSQERRENGSPLSHPPAQKVFNQSEIERTMLHGLFCEWEKALWVLKSPNREKIRAPLFGLGDSQDRWGSWSQGKREITLSRRLVFEHSWDAVREVLLHETAHQYADEILGASGESPHGPRFQEACHLLRANPKASGTYLPLDQRIQGRGMDPENKILSRTRKLMALAESPDLHEAEAAMAKAHALIAKYNFYLLEAKEKRQFLTVALGRPALRHPAEVYALAHLLQEFYFVRGIWVPAYVLEKGKMGRVLEISGTLPNIQVASYAFDFVSRFIGSQWAAYIVGRNLGRGRQTDFALGILAGFRSKLKSGEEKEEGSSALVRIADPHLKQYLRYKYPNTVTIRGGRIRQDPRVMKDGSDVGKKLVIARGITNPAESRGLQIGGGKRIGEIR